MDGTLAENLFERGIIMSGDGPAWMTTQAIGRGPSSATLRFIPESGRGPFAPTNVDWGWANGGGRRPELGAHAIKETMDEAIAATERKARDAFPRRYVLNGLTGAHKRLYERMIRERMAGSGYRRIEGVGNDVILDPTAEAYARWLLRHGAAPAAGGGVGVLTAMQASDGG